MASEQFSLCWDNFHKNMSSGMNSMLENEDLVDVTLAVEGKYLKAHKMVLSVCSPYFKELFKANPCQHPIVFMKDVSYVAISDLLQFMYQGEVQVSQDNLTTFIKTAEALQIKGLTGDGNGSADADSEVTQERQSNRHVEETYKPAPRPKKQLPAPVVTTTAAKRPRLSVSSNDSQSALPQPVTKTEPVSASTSETPPIQFKMEPYDQNQSVTIPDDGADETFGDETLDDATVDDTEDYAMMEGEEPQAGTSTDGAGEGQGYSKVVSGRIIVGGFTYHQNCVNPSTNVRYVICSEYRRLACKARASIPAGGGPSDLVLTNAHNHPPTPEAYKKAEFVKLVKSYITKEGTRLGLRSIYNFAIQIFPDAKHFYPYSKLASSMRRWRKLAVTGTLKVDSCQVEAI